MSNIRTLSKKNPKCPYCLKEDITWKKWIDGDEDGFITTCVRCGKKYKGTCVIDYVFFTEEYREKKSAASLKLVH